MNRPEVNSDASIDTPTAADIENICGCSKLVDGHDSDVLWPEDFAEALVDELLEQTRDLPVGRVASLAELHAKVPALSAAVAALRQSATSTAVLELPNGLPGIFASSSFAAPLWIVSVPGADAAELRLLSVEGAKESPMLCPWPNLWHKDLLIPLGSAARPICAMLSQFSARTELLRCDSALLLAYVSEAGIAFGVRHSPVDDISAHYLANYKPLGKYPLHVLQTSVLWAKRKPAMLHHVGVYQTMPTLMHTSLPKDRPAPLPNRVNTLDVMTGYLSDMATFGRDFPHELTEKCLLILASDDAYDYLLSSGTPEVSATLFMRAGNVERICIRIEGPSDVLEIVSKFEGGSVTAKIRLDLPLYAQRQHDGALCAIPRVAFGSIVTRQLNESTGWSPRDHVAGPLHVNKHRFKASLDGLP